MKYLKKGIKTINSYPKLLIFPAVITICSLIIYLLTILINSDGISPIHTLFYSVLSLALPFIVNLFIYPIYSSVIHMLTNDKITNKNLIIWATFKKTWHKYPLQIVMIYIILAILIIAIFVPSGIIIAVFSQVKYADIGIALSFVLFIFLAIILFALIITVSNFIMMFFVMIPEDIDILKLILLTIKATFKKFWTVLAIIFIPGIINAVIYILYKYIYSLINNMTILDTFRYTALDYSYIITIVVSVIAHLIISTGLYALWFDIRKDFVGDSNTDIVYKFNDKPSISDIKEIPE